MVTNSDFQTSPHNPKKLVSSSGTVGRLNPSLLRLATLVTEVGPLTALYLRSLSFLLTTPFVFGMSSPLYAQTPINPHQYRRQQQHFLQQEIQQHQRLQQRLEHHRRLHLHQHRQVDEYLNQRQQQFRQQLQQRKHNIHRQYLRCKPFNIKHKNDEDRFHKAKAL